MDWVLGPNQWTFYSRKLACNGHRSFEITIVAKENNAERKSAEFYYRYSNGG
jgi:hypothetical protein